MNKVGLLCRSCSQDWEEDWGEDWEEDWGEDWEEDWEEAQRCPRIGVPTRDAARDGAPPNHPRDSALCDKLCWRHLLQNPYPYLVGHEDRRHSYSAGYSIASCPPE